MHGYEKIRRAKVRAARRRLARKRLRWQGKVITSTIAHHS